MSPYCPDIILMRGTWNRIPAPWLPVRILLEVNPSVGLDTALIPPEILIAPQTDVGGEYLTPPLVMISPGGSSAMRMAMPAFILNTCAESNNDTGTG
jgi:hypothetical protein